MLKLNKIYYALCLLVVSQNLYLNWPQYSIDWFDVMPVQEVVQKNSAITYQPCFGRVYFDLPPFPLAPSYAHQGYFKECFILTVPGGRAHSCSGFTIIDNHFIKELIWSDQEGMLTVVPPIDENMVCKISGRVAVIAHVAINSYCHWLEEVLTRLALLEMHNVSYDWLYVPYHSSYVKSTLQLWGIDSSKIISPTGDQFCIQADQLIIPSMVTNTNVGFNNHNGIHTHPILLNYVRNKLIAKAQQQATNAKFNSKVFISRKDAPFRKIINEDEVFELFAKQGFERYELGKMNIIDQILLMNHAEIVVGEHGAGLVNTMFCKPRTKVIEIFQALLDASFWYLAQDCDLDYVPVATIEFANGILPWASDTSGYVSAWKANSIIPLSVIENLISSLK